MKKIETYKTSLTEWIIFTLIFGSSGIWSDENF